MSSRKPGRYVQVIAGVHMGKRGFAYNRDQEPAIIKAKKVAVWVPAARFGWINQINNFFLCGGHTKAYKTRWNSDNEKTPLRKFWGGNETVKPEIIY